MQLDPQQRQIIANSKQSVSWFLRNCCQVKHPSAGMLPFNPFNYQKKALSSFRNNRFCIFKKCRQCFVGESMVWGPNGPKRIDEIEVGDLVYSLDRSTGLLTSVPVLEVFDNGERECVRVVSKTGHVSTATADHRYFTWNGEVEAGKLTTADVLMEVNEPERYGVDVDESEAALLGYMITDGYYGKTVHFTNTTWRYLLDFQKHLYRRFGVRGDIKPHGRDENGKVVSYRINVYAPAFKDWLRDLGIYGQVKDKKVLPDAVFRWSNKSLSMMLNRMWAADGWYSGGHCNEAGIGIESLVALNQIKQLLSRFGVNAKVYPATKRDMPKLRLYGSTSFANFHDKIGAFGKKPRCPMTKGFFFNRRKGEVKEVKPVGMRRVYDLRVPPHDNYVVDGVVVHNSGISKISGAYATWFAMMHPLKTVLVVSKTDADAMTFLNDNIKFLFKNLPEWMQELWLPPGSKDNEHEIVFANGSRIRSLTSAPDVLRSNASSLNIIDEAAFIQNMDIMWSGGWPTMQHGGSTIVISTCIVPDSYVFTDRGMQQIGDFEPISYDGFADGYHHVDIDQSIASPYGKLTKAVKFYKRDPEPIRLIETESGYKLGASTRHRIKTMVNGKFDYNYVSDIKPGDYVPIMRGPGLFGNDDELNFHDTGWDKNPDRRHPTELRIDRMTEELAYILGMILAEGNMYDTGVTITNGDERILNEIINNKLGLRWNRTDANHITCSSTRFARFLKWFGFKQCRAYDKSIPRRLWSCSRPMVAAFLRGMYDGDGHSRTRDGEVGLTSTSKTVIDQVRLWLLNFGIVCRQDYHKAYSKEFNLNNRSYVSECRESWQLIVRSGEAAKFYEAIGFGLDRKQRNSDVCKDNRERIPNAAQFIRAFRAEANISISKMRSAGVHQSVLHGRKDRPLEAVMRSTVEKVLTSFKQHENLPSYKDLLQIADPAIYWDRIESMTDDCSEVMDFTIPETKSFWSNGFDSHNTNGVGGWYWATWTDAEIGANPFHPIVIEWWDMDWAIEYRDSASGKDVRIAPTDGLVDCTGKVITHPEFGEIVLDPIRYGPKWSPWLEGQFRGLQEKGETWKFDQEILAQFVGSGNTVLDKAVLAHIETTVCDPLYKITGPQGYVHPVSGEVSTIDFTPALESEGLWIWKDPVKPKPAKMRGSTVIEPGTPAHVYVAGVDLSTGKSKDYHTIEIFDLMTMEQVAEYMGHCLPRVFKLIVDKVARHYNCALTVVERNNGGGTFIDELRFDLNYPKLWRKREVNDRPRKGGGQSVTLADYGFLTTIASKPMMNQFLLNSLRDKPGEGYTIYSRRLHKQLSTYVRKRDKSGKDTGRTEAESGAANFDDLVIACGLALIGAPDAVTADATSLVPLTHDGFANLNLTDVNLDKFAEVGGQGLIMPMKIAPDLSYDMDIQSQLEQYAMQLGGIPMTESALIAPTSKRRHVF